MSNLLQALVEPRQDAIDAARDQFVALASPGAVLDGEERVALASAARTGDTADELQTLAHHLYVDPATVHEDHVRAAADVVGDPVTVEAVGIVSRLSSVDRIHSVLAVDPEPLPDPLPGQPTGEIEMGLKRRRGFLPKPPGEIPTTLDLVPSEGRALRAMFGPMYMTEHEMGDPHFGREPGLNTPQLETVAARISLLNQCFYWVFSHARRLSWSGETLGHKINLEAIGGADVELGIQGGNELIKLVDVFFASDIPGQESSRRSVIEVLGPESLFDAATVFGNFEMMNRVAEGTGIGIPRQWIDRHAEMVEALQLADVMKSQQA